MTIVATKASAIKKKKTQKTAEVAPLSLIDRMHIKTQDIYQELVVDKRAALSDKLGELPRFVLEYLIAASHYGSRKIRLDTVKKQILNGTITAANKKMFLSGLMEKGSASMIGNISFTPMLAQEAYKVHIGQLGDETKVFISNDLVHILKKEHPGLLNGSMWGSIGLIYVDKSVELASFTPYQASVIDSDMDKFREGRTQYNTLDWIDLLIISMGYNPAMLNRSNPPEAELKPLLHLDPVTKKNVPTLDDDGNPIVFDPASLRKKLLLLCRLLPLCMNNHHMCELGPRQSGKSYALRNLSPRVFLIPGGKITPAQLIHSNARGNEKAGIIGNYQTALFDEIGNTSFPDRGLVAALKEYMASNIISRGSGPSTTSDCSIVFSGNIDLALNGQPMGMYESYFEVFPKELGDTAMVDRIAGFISGWELPVMSDEYLATGVGFLADFFGEVLSRMRREEYTNWEEFCNKKLIVDAIDNNGGPSKATIRDERAIKRNAAGLMKMLYPHGATDFCIDEYVLQMAVELRQIVYNQLCKMSPGEFKPKTLRCRFK